MKKQDKNTENQEFENKTLDDVTPEPTIDTDTITADQDINNIEAKADTDKMADEVSVWQDKYVRLSAEFDNFRKRTLKEKMDLISNGGEDILKAIIPVVDDFERAIAALGANTEMTAEQEGIQLIYQKLTDVLKSKNVVQIDALDRPLDVDFHDAVAKVPTDDSAKKGVVIDVVQTGYMLGDKVLRFAKVVVGE